MKLHIAKDLSLPLEAVTQTIAILAKRRAGKSYTMRRLIEQLFGARQQVVMVDPKGDQWGVRSAADGKAPGLPIVILGGERGDAPLESSSGEVVAKLVVEERVSVLLDLSLFRKHEVATFMTAFLENLYRLKAREIYRTPMMLVIDEADAIAPQKPQKGEERMLGAAEDIVRRGGQRGIGCVLVTQRSAVLNKNVLTQAQMLVALRTIAPQDLAAMNAWIDVHGTPEQRKTLMESLPSLPVGDAWFWSPGWPTAEGIFKRTHVLPIETFDSGKSPEPGVKPVEPKNLADVDLDALKRQMAATIEKAKADDPKLLRKRIAELERLDRNLPKVAALGAGKAELAAEYTRGREDGFEAGQIKTNAVLELYIRRQTQLIQRVASAADEALKHAGIAQGEVVTIKLPALDTKSLRAKAALDRLATMPTPPRPRIGNGKGEEMAMVERKFLTALAQQGRSLTRNQVAIFAGYSAKSRHVDNTLAALRSNQYVTGGRDGIEITDAGLKALGAYDPLPTGTDLRDYWMRNLDKAASTFLGVVCDVYPNSITRDELAIKANYSPSSRHVDNTLAQLRSRDLVSGGRDAIKASEDLFS